MHFIVDELIKLCLNILTFIAADLSCCCLVSKLIVPLPDDISGPLRLSLSCKQTFTIPVCSGCGLRCEKISKVPYHFSDEIGRGFVSFAIKHKEVLLHDVTEVIFGVHQWRVSMKTSYSSSTPLHVDDWFRSYLLKAIKNMLTLDFRKVPYHILRNIHSWLICIRKFHTTEFDLSYKQAGTSMTSC